MYSQHVDFYLLVQMFLFSSLTARNAGLMATQQTLQNNPGALPSIA